MSKKELYPRDVVQRELMQMFGLLPLTDPKQLVGTSHYATYLYVMGMHGHFVERLDRTLKSDSTSIIDSMDGTCRVRIKGKDLCRMTPRSELELVDHPFNWGNKVKAIEELLLWEKQERDIREEEFQKRRGM